MWQCIVSGFCRKISYTAVFVAIWALFTCIITGVWWLVPLCSEAQLLQGRWFVSIIPLLYLLITHKLRIN